jgi:hypothetical protein
MKGAGYGGRARREREGRRKRQQVPVSVERLRPTGVQDVSESYDSGSRWLIQQLYRQTVSSREGRAPQLARRLVDFFSARSFPFYQINPQAIFQEGV